MPPDAGAGGAGSRSAPVRILETVAARYGFRDRRSWRLFASYYRPHLWGLAVYALGAAVVSFLVLPVMLLVKHAFEHAIPEGRVGLLVALGAGIVGIRLAGTVAGLALRMHVVRIIKSAIRRMREDLLEQLYQRPREQFTQADVDRLQTRIVQDTERVDTMSNALLSGVLPALLSSVALLAVLLAFSWQLVLACVLLLPLVWFAAMLTNRFVARDVRLFQGAYESFSKGVSFVLRQMDLTRVQGAEPQEIARQRQVLENLRTSGEQMSFSYAIHGQLQSTMINLVGIALLVIGGIEVARGDLSLGSFIAFYFGAGLLNGQVGTVVGGTAPVAAGSVSLATLAGILDAAASPPAYQGTKQIDFRGRFTLRDVTFEYPRGVVLRRTSVDIPPGSRVAIIGPNGAGKSTLVNLLLGLSAPTSGDALADGEPYIGLDLRHIRRQIGVVLQRAGLFHGSIRANLTYGNDDAPEAAVVEAARLAGIHDFIAALPAGYDTEVGEGGITLSGGENQRIAVARALLRRPAALVLDEPTNHLDVGAVGALLETLRRLPERPTVIVVSHDARVVAFADIVCRVQGGVVSVEAGGTAGPARVAAGGG
jgi:ATP-binding cassette subfamily B protein